MHDTTSNAPPAIYILQQTCFEYIKKYVHAHNAICFAQLKYTKMHLQEILAMN